MRRFDREFGRTSRPWVRPCSKAQLRAEQAAVALGAQSGPHTAQLGAWILAGQIEAHQFDHARHFPTRYGGWDYPFTWAMPEPWPGIEDRLWDRLPREARYACGSCSPAVLRSISHYTPEEREAATRRVFRLALAAFRAGLACPLGARTSGMVGWGRHKKPRIVLPVRIVARERGGKFVAEAVSKDARSSRVYRTPYRFRPDTGSPTGWSAARVSKPGEYRERLKSQSKEAH